MLCLECQVGRWKRFWIHYVSRKRLRRWVKLADQWIARLGPNPKEPTAKRIQHSVSPSCQPKLSAQAVAIGGAILFSILKSSADENMIYARTAGVRRAYQQDSQTFRSLMVGSLIAGAAIYIYNLVDVTAVPKKVPLQP